MRLLTVDEIIHYDRDGSILWKEEKLTNVFHRGGQQFMLLACYNTSSVSVPTSYYLGLDARSTPLATDSLANLSDEPTQNGYGRQTVASLNGFTVSLGSDGNYSAVSNIVRFAASGGSWGPIKNLFLTTGSASTGYLISTVPLGATRTISDGQGLTVRISLSLSNC